MRCQRNAASFAWGGLFGSGSSLVPSSQVAAQLAAQAAAQLAAVVPFLGNQLCGQIQKLNFIGYFFFIFFMLHK